MLSQDTMAMEDMVPTAISISKTISSIAIVSWLSISLSYSISISGSLAIVTSVSSIAITSITITTTIAIASVSVSWLSDGNSGQKGDSKLKRIKLLLFSFQLYTLVSYKALHDVK